jgi:hypothetical protein
VRARATVLGLVAATSSIALLAGCGPDRSEASRHSSGPTPKVGGPAPAQHLPPHHPMDRLERPVAAELARHIAGQGLTLGYLDCPHWGGAVPGRLTCRGYVDGVLAAAAVRLTAAGTGVSYDAWLAGGVVATRRLERRLHDAGWVQVDCGDVAAYPALTGTRIVCRVERGTRHSYLVATVSGPTGMVTIGDYAPTASQ